MRRLALLALPALLLPAACRSAAEPEETPAAPAAVPWPEAPPRALHAGWATQSPWEFEERVAALGAGPWDPFALEELARALEPMDLVSVRAAVLLARGEEASREVLLARLEKRAQGPERHSDAADVVAARALERWPDEDTARRLAALAEGPDPHPDLEVRVECGAVALELGRDEVIPFLLRVLHAGTPAEIADPGDWKPTTTLAWAKGRAADALARRAGVPNTFRPDGSYESQMRVARELAERLPAKE